jgi:2-methylcitrate dehydratase PrpD
MRGFMARVRVEPDDSLLPRYPRIWPVRTVVVTPSGRYPRAIEHVPGDPARPFGEHEVADKFRQLTAEAIEDTELLFGLCNAVVIGDARPSALLEAIEVLCENQ